MDHARTASLGRAARQETADAEIAAVVQRKSNADANDTGETKQQSVVVIDFVCP